MTPSPNTFTGHFIGNHNLLLETEKERAKSFFALTFTRFVFYKKLSLNIAKILKIFFKKPEKYLFVAKEIYAK